MNISIRAGIPTLAAILTPPRELAGLHIFTKKIYQKPVKDGVIHFEQEICMRLPIDVEGTMASGDGSWVERYP
jgi:hypothetical protein